MGKAERERRARALYTTLAGDLAKVTGSVTGGIILCPQCLRAHGPEAIQTGVLTLEHVPPAKVGGKPVTLTCKEPCNNRHGSKIDKHLIQLLRMQDALEGHGAVPGSALGRTGSFAANIAWATGTGADPTVVRFVKNGGNPAVIQEIHDRVNAGGVSLTMNFGFIPDGFRRAVLRAVHLSLFSRAGYRYGLSPTADSVRKMILAEDVITIPILEAFSSASVLPFVPVKTREGDYVLITITVRTARVRHFSVPLPVAGQVSKEQLDTIANEVRKHVIKVQSTTTGATVEIRFGEDPLSWWGVQE